MQTSAPNPRAYGLGLNSSAGDVPGSPGAEPSKAIYDMVGGKRSPEEVMAENTARMRGGSMREVQEPQSPRPRHTQPIEPEYIPPQTESSLLRESSLAFNAAGESCAPDPGVYGLGGPRATLVVMQENIEQMRHGGYLQEETENEWHGAADVAPASVEFTAEILEGYEQTVADLVAQFGGTLEWYGQNAVMDIPGDQAGAFQQRLEDQVGAQVSLHEAQQRARRRFSEAVTITPQMQEVLAELGMDASDFNDRGVYAHPGKFQGEGLATLWFYNGMMNGYRSDLEFEYPAEDVYIVGDDDRKALPGLLDNVYAFGLHHREDGFVEGNEVSQADFERLTAESEGEGLNEYGEARGKKGKGNKGKKKQPRSSGGYGMTEAKEFSVGFAIDTGTQDTVEEYFREDYGREPNEADWVKINEDVSKIERNVEAWLNEHVGPALNEGHSDNVLIGTIYPEVSRDDVLNFVMQHSEHGESQTGSGRYPIPWPTDSWLEGTSEFATSLPVSVGFFGISAEAYDLWENGQFDRMFEGPIDLEEATYSGNARTGRPPGAVEPPDRSDRGERATYSGNARTGKPQGSYAPSGRSEAGERARYNGNARTGSPSAKGGVNYSPSGKSDQGEHASFSGHARTGKPRMEARQTGFLVFLDGQEIDKVFYSGNVDEEEVRQSLINHDGYDPGIVVEREGTPPLQERTDKEWYGDEAPKFVEIRDVKNDSVTVVPVAEFQKDNPDVEIPPLGETVTIGGGAAVQFEITGLMNEARRPLREYFDTDESVVAELVLYADNEAKLYSQKKDILANVMRRVKKGTYDPTLAPKLWMYWVDAAAKSYAVEFDDPGERGRSWSQMFPKAVREKAAQEIAEREYQDVLNGEYDPRPDTGDPLA